MRERRKMAEGDNNSVYQLVREGGRPLGPAGGGGRARPALLCSALPAVGAGGGRSAPRCMTRFGAGGSVWGGLGAARGAGAAAAGLGRGSGGCAAAREPEPPAALGVA